MDPITDSYTGLGVLSGQGNTPSISPAGPSSPAGVAMGAGGGGGDAVPDFEHGSIGGIRVFRGSARRGRAPIQPVDRPECAIAQCHCHVETAYFTRINITAAPTITAGQSAVYGLAKLDVRQQFGQEARILGVHWHLLPCDYNGTGLGTASASPLPWGDARGLSAAVLVGVNLPSQLGAWTSGTIYAPGLELNQASPPVSACQSTQLGQRFLCAPIRFPTGTFDQVTPNMNIGSASLEGDAGPVLAGETLDVALVMDRAYVTGLTGQVCGFAQIGIVVGHTVIQRPFRL